MTAFQNQDDWLAELAEGNIPEQEVERWLAAHPERAAELEVARRVRQLVAELRAAEFEVPAGFEARVLARVQQDASLRALLDFGFNGVGSLLLELISLIFGLLPRSAAPATAS